MRRMKGQQIWADGDSMEVISHHTYEGETIATGLRRALGLDDRPVKNNPRFNERVKYDFASLDVGEAVTFIKNEPDDQRKIRNAMRSYARRSGKEFDFRWTALDVTVRRTV